MLEKKNEERNQVELICIEEFVPKDHLLRKIENAVNFMKIYEMVPHTCQTRYFKDVSNRTRKRSRL